MADDRKGGTGAGERPAGPFYSRSAEILWRRVADEVLILAPGAAAPATLSSAAALVWDLLDRPVTELELRAALTSVVGDSARELVAGVEWVVEELASAGLVVAVEDANVSAGP